MIVSTKREVFDVINLKNRLPTPGELTRHTRAKWTFTSARGTQNDGTTRGRAPLKIPATGALTANSWECRSDAVA
ncbi:hypothetical protein SB719_19295, partial [Pantoea sp. SIMBA_079]|uniref:hypothetical protein n=1 Tax=Pantoea sp. SIMBA_079 TaxID=3085817 RepID=UPI00399439E3